MALESMQDLLIHQLQDIYSAEQMILRAFPKVVERASAPELKAALQEHIGETQTQVGRLERIFKLLEESPRGKKCQAMEGLIAEIEEMLDEEGNDAVIDAGIIADTQRVEHYEITAYGSAKAFATLLGLREVVQLLNESQEEETAGDKKLSLIATTDVNARAAGTDPSMAARAS
jgi:ferritin-like metal-binding protein YciE